METNPNVVNDDLTNQQASDATKQEVLSAEEVKQPAQPGSKTEPTELLKSLQEERERRRLAEEKAKLVEEELNNIKSSIPSEDVFSDEGKALKNHIDSLKSELSSLKEERELEQVFNQYPDLKQMRQDFDEYRQDYPRHKLVNIAKLFLSEKGIIDAPARKGLEKPTGGDRTPVKTGMSAEEVKNLRINNPKQYRDMLKKDQIKID